jgi:hypothetical protein
MWAKILILMSTVLIGGVGAEVDLLAQVSVPKKIDLLIIPNKLVKAHQIKEIGDKCTICHDLTGELPDKKCLDCHKAIGRRMENKIGYHSTFKEPCRECHKDHPATPRSIVSLDEKKFDHNRAAFKLKGKHLDLKCDKCHRRRPFDRDVAFYTEIKSSLCLDCHKDPHESKLDNKCESCHTVNDWHGKELTFDHNRDSEFQLNGKHAKVECVKCHKPRQGQILGSAVFRDLDRKCVSCHKDHHESQFGNTCAQCHTANDWRGKGLTFDHNRDSKFQLNGKHAKVECVKCHKPRSPSAALSTAPFRGIKTDCVACHTDDPHRGKLGNTCTACHTANDWHGKELTFDHNRDSKYQLNGKHAKVECIKCHKPPPGRTALGFAVFKGIKFSNCFPCHADPHKGEYDMIYGPWCVPCHSIAGFTKKEPKFDHNSSTQFALLGRHVEVKCVTCHNRKLVKTVNTELLKQYQTRCDSCHEDPHATQLGADCKKCHDSVGWRGTNLLFKHNVHAKYQIDDTHKKVACKLCHKNGHYKPIEPTCKTCHTKYFLSK